MSLRRALSAICTVLVVIPVPAWASARSDTTTRYRVDSLRALWILPPDAHGDLRTIAVLVTRRTNLDTDEVTFNAGAGKGECFSTADSFGCETLLSSYKVVKFDANETFTAVDVVIARGHRRHSVSFAATQPFAFVPPAGQSPNTCKGTTTTVYLHAENATAEGHVFRRDVSTASEYDDQRESEKMIQTLENEDCSS
jgi:hypothetical protein